MMFLERSHEFRSQSVVIASRSRAQAPSPIPVLELAIHIGYEQAGWRELFVAGQVGWLLYEIKPVIIAVLLQALWKLGKKAIKDWPTGIIGGAAILAYAWGSIKSLCYWLLASRSY